MVLMLKQNLLLFFGEEFQLMFVDMVLVFFLIGIGLNLVLLFVYVCLVGCCLLWVCLFGCLVELWLLLKIELEDLGQYNDGCLVMYVLEDYGLFNVLILDKVCCQVGLLLLLVLLVGDLIGCKCVYLVLLWCSFSNLLIFEQCGVKIYFDLLVKVLQVYCVCDDLDVYLVLVLIFVGCVLDKQSGWFVVLFLENWVLVGCFCCLLGFLLNGCNIIVCFVLLILLCSIVDEGLELECMVCKLQCVLCIYFCCICELVIGLDLLIWCLLVDQVLVVELVCEVIVVQVKCDNLKLVDVWKKVYVYVWEIVVDYFSLVVCLVSFMFSYVWNCIYVGVLVYYLDKFKVVVLGYEVVYVFSYCSYMDYLLLFYLLYDCGIVLLYIVVGINLNLLVVGILLCKGGVFFICCLICGNVLYFVVFSEYVVQLVVGGYLLEYFVEGGCLCIGCLLQFKGGMILMMLCVFLCQLCKLVLFQFIYIGYEKLMEGGSYLDELFGWLKEKELIWLLLWGIFKVFKQNYGQVVVNFGELIVLNDVLVEKVLEWKGEVVFEDEKLVWLLIMVDMLVECIQVCINGVVDVNFINLLVLVLLFMLKYVMGEVDLIVQIEFCKMLLVEMLYLDWVMVILYLLEWIIVYVEEINVFICIKYLLGDVFSVSGDIVVLLSYFCNNVVYLFIVLLWVVCCFQNNCCMSCIGLVQLGCMVYLFLQVELFLLWSEDEFVQCIDCIIDVFVCEGLLQNVNDDDGGILVCNIGQIDEVFCLWVIGYLLQQVFECYYIVILVLVKNGFGVFGVVELESLCQQVVQCLSLFYVLVVFEFFDKVLFCGFIQKLCELCLVWLDENSKLLFDECLDVWVKDVKFILGCELCYIIEWVSLEVVCLDEFVLQD